MPHATDTLRDLVVVFAVAVAVVVAFARFRLPSIAGLVVAGTVVGPGGFGIVKDASSVSLLSEVGVALLLFTLGLEFPLARLRKLWRMVAVGGSLQVGITAVGAAAVAYALGNPLPRAVFAGFAVALSSTAIALRALGERNEQETLHGRFMLGILIFQDLCVIPMMLAIPLLAGRAGGAADVAIVLGKAAVVVAGVLAASRWVAPRVLGAVARTRSREAFVMATVLACLGVAWVTSLAGLSLALGAFLAGLAVAETEFGDQAMADVLPFRDTLVGLFFVSVGMLLDVDHFGANPGGILLLAAGIVVLKAALAAVVGLVLRLPLRAAVLTGLGLAQVGEFTFVLAGAARVEGLADEDFLAPLLAAAVLSMLVTPFLVRLAPHVATGLGRFGALERLLGFWSVEDSPATVRRLHDHVVVAGFGVGGRILGEDLTRAGTPFVVLELNPETVREGRVRGIPVFYGDSTIPAVLRSAGLPRARVLVLLLSDGRATDLAVRAAREVAPEVPVVARTRYLSHAEALREEGRVEVVSEEYEASIEVLASALRRLGVPPEDVERRVRDARGEGFCRVKPS